MTKREKAYMRERANKYFKWYLEEGRKGMKANDPEEKAHHQIQARLNWNTYNAFEQLIDEMEGLK